MQKCEIRVCHRQRKQEERKKTTDEQSMNKRRTPRGNARL